MHHFLFLIFSLFIATSYAAAPEVPRCYGPSSGYQYTADFVVPTKWSPYEWGGEIISLSKYGDKDFVPSIDLDSFFIPSTDAYEKGDFTPREMEGHLYPPEGFDLAVTGTGTTTIDGRSAYWMSYSLSRGPYAAVYKRVWIKNPWRAFTMELSSAPESFKSDNEDFESLRRSMRLMPQDPFGDTSFCILSFSNFEMWQLDLRNNGGNGYERDRVAGLVSIATYIDAEAGVQIDILRGKKRGKSDLEKMKKIFISRKWLRKSHKTVFENGNEWRYFKNAKAPGKSVSDVRFKMIGPWIYAIVLTVKSPDLLPDNALDVLIETMMFDPELKRG